MAGLVGRLCRVAAETLITNQGQCFLAFLILKQILWNLKNFGTGLKLTTNWFTALRPKTWKAPIHT